MILRNSAGKTCGECGQTYDHGCVREFRCPYCIQPKPTLSKPKPVLPVEMNNVLEIAKLTALLESIFKEVELTDDARDFTLWVQGLAKEYKNEK